MKLLPEKIVSDTHMKCSFDGQTLRIKCGYGSSIVPVNGDVSISGGTIFSNSSISCVQGGTVVINGVKVTQDDLNQIAKRTSQNETDEEECLEYVWECDPVIDNISTEGSGN